MYFYFADDQEVRTMNVLGQFSNERTSLSEFLRHQTMVSISEEIILKLESKFFISFCFADLIEA